MSLKRLSHFLARFLLFSFFLFLFGCNQLSQPEPEAVTLSGTGLSAQYFANSDFSGVRQTRTDKHIFFDWEATAPIKGVSGDFSARWQASLRVPKTATYQFFLSATGEAKLFLDDVEVLAETDYLLKAGEAYAFQLDFVKTQAQADIKLEWQAEGLTRELIPQLSFSPTTTVEVQAVTQGLNLLVNPNFDIDTGAWNLYGAGTKSASLPDQDGTGQALKAEAFAWIQQDLAVSDIEVGQIYTLTAFAKVDSGGCTLGFAGDTFNEKLVFTSNTWTEKGLSVTLPANTNWMAVYLSSGNPACYLDTVSLVAGDSTPPLPPTDSNELIQNGGFEGNLENWQAFGGTSSLNTNTNFGNQALSASAFTWIQQDLITSLLTPNQSYSFSAFVKTTQLCTVGLVIATDQGIVLNEALSFSNTVDWQLKSLDITAPQNSQWAAVYIASGSSACLLDDISLNKIPSDINPTAFSEGSILDLAGQQAGTVVAKLEKITNIVFGDIIHYGTDCSFEGFFYGTQVGNEVTGTLTNPELNTTASLSLRRNYIKAEFSFDNGSCQGETREFSLTKTTTDPLLDAELRLLLFQNDVQVLTPQSNLNQNKVELGRLLFHDKELSGNRDISCSTCHSADLATVDARALSIGTKGTGSGASRQLGQGRNLFPRNSAELFNKSFLSTQFWDGRVSGTAATGFTTPAGNQLPTGLDDALAAQALFPLINRNEMLGLAGDTDINNQANELAAFASSNQAAIWNAIMARILAIPEYEQRFGAAYPTVSPSNLGIEHAVNAISEYQKDAYTTLNSPFDAYLAGNNNALTEDQKQGAIVFYGIGNCAACHSGTLQTDEDFHNIAVPQLGPGIDANGLDLGRYLVTGVEADKFAFRTPSLRNVTLTAPYMHNGAFTELVDAVDHYHLIEDSLRNYDPSQLELSLRDTVKTDTDTINQILATLSDEAKNLPLEGRANSLVAFLETLTDPRALDLSDVIPASVPSGLPIND